MRWQWRLKHTLIATACLATLMGISRNLTGEPFLLLLVASGLTVLAAIALSPFAVIWMWAKVTNRTEREKRVPSKAFAMRTLPARLTVPRLMMLVACVGASLGAFRLHLSFGSFVTFVAVTAPYRSFAIADQCRAAGHPLSHREAVLNLLGSALVTTIILGVSTVAAMAVYFLVDHLEHEYRPRRTDVPYPIVSGLGLSLALPVGWLVAMGSRVVLWASHHGESWTEPASHPPGSLPVPERTQ